MSNDKFEWDTGDVGIITLKGGAGSGNFGHSGRPGKVGGSSSSSGYFTRNGSPIEFYHGTGVQFDKFDAGKIGTGADAGSESWYGAGVYLTGEKWKGSAYAHSYGDSGKVATVTTHVKSPFVVSGTSASALHEALTANGIDVKLRGSALTDELKSKGYDSVLVMKDDGVKYNELVVFDPADINVVKFTDVAEFKGGAGSGNFGHAGRIGKVGGSGPATMGQGVTGGWLPPEERVWQGKQYSEPQQLDIKQTGNIGEHMAAKAMQDSIGAEFVTLNHGINNAPIDLGGDSTAIEVKAGSASNGRSAHHWRATISKEGKAERQLVKQMSPEERREYNQYKQEQVFQRKQTLLDEMSTVAGHEIKPVTIGVILTPDGKRGDVFRFDGFHARIGWNKITDDNYMGTYQIDNPEQYKGGAGSGNWGHAGRPGKVGGSGGGAVSSIKNNLIAVKNTPKRQQLAAEAEHAFQLLQKDGLLDDVKEITVVGSYASDKESPDDIDMIFVVSDNSWGARYAKSSFYTDYILPKKSNITIMNVTDNSPGSDAMLKWFRDGTMERYGVEPMTVWTK